MNQEFDNAFCVVRPPGHHAEKEQAMGFCIFNNVAVGATYLLEKYKLDKVAIIDFDVHHGNGTQDIFYNENKGLYISSHQFPFYPGTGSTGRYTCTCFVPRSYPSRKYVTDELRTFERKRDPREQTRDEVEPLYIRV